MTTPKSRIEEIRERLARATDDDMARLIAQVECMERIVDAARKLILPSMQCGVYEKREDILRERLEALAALEAGGA